MKRIFPLYILLLLLVIASCSGAESETTSVSEPLPLNGDIITLSVKGLHCEACVVSTTNVLEKLEGVAGVEVSLDDETAVIKPAIDTYPDLDEIAEALRKIGYEVEFIEL